MKSNALNWFEIAVAVADFDRAKAFYEEALATSMDVIDGDIKMAIFPYDQAKGIGGALTAGKNSVTGPGGTTVYLNVEGDLDGVIARIPGAGGKVLQPRREVPPHGFIAVFNDTEGNVVGLHSME
jgi:predicted enzyme related to lactoylglutathione lyase